MIYCYKVKMRFDEETNRQYWISVLKAAVECYNFISDYIWTHKDLALNQIAVHRAVYHSARSKFPLLPSQMVCGVIKKVTANYKANRRKYKCIAHNMSLSLDKRLYSNLTPESIRIVSSIKNKRCTCNFIPYDKFNDLASKYKMKDPTINYNGKDFFLAVPFDVPDAPFDGNNLDNNSYLGVDLGIRRFYTTSEGNSLKTKDFNAEKRQIRYLKRKLQAKKHSHSARIKLKKVRRKERNLNKEMCNLTANQILNTDKKVIVLEDLTKIKQNTSKHKNGIKRTKHNNMISQVPFFMLRSILSFKALRVGKRVETVDPAYTSQTNCLTHEKDGIRKGCRYCCKDNLVLDADWNASVNIAFKKHPISFEMPLDGRLNLMGRVRQQPKRLESNL